MMKPIFKKSNINNLRAFGGIILVDQYIVKYPEEGFNVLYFWYEEAAFLHKRANHLISDPILMKYLITHKSKCHNNMLFMDSLEEIGHQFSINILITTVSTNL